MKFEYINGIPSESKLRPHDVITIIPGHKTKNEYKLYEKISSWIVLDDIGDSKTWTANTLRENVGFHTFRVIKINYKKYPWWQFWKKNKYVEKYYLEIL